MPDTILNNTLANEFEDPYFNALTEQFSRLPQVEAIALSGSRAKGVCDATSDYDLYIYLNAPLDPAIRHDILSQVCSYMEINNQFWETEDDCTLKNGIDIDIIYRSLPDISSQIKAVTEGLAYCGYTTCLWDNVQSAKILFDRNQDLQALVDSLPQQYPETLRKNIIEKNMRLLTGNLPSYDRQIKKAVSRGDWISVQHRTAAYLESCFDLLFAMNKMLHPGEKRMLEKIKNAPLLPENFEQNLQMLLENEFTDSDKFLRVLDAVTESFAKLVQENAEIEHLSGSN